MIENLPVATVCISKGQIFLNKKAEQLTGYSREEFKNLDDWFQICYGKGAEGVRALYEEAKAAGFSKIDRITFTTKNGEKRIFDFNSSLNGEIELWVIDDVTERLMVEERFTVLFDHSSDAHLIFDEVGIVDCNKAAVQMLNAKSKDHLLTLHALQISPVLQPCGTKSTEKGKQMVRLARERGYHRFEWQYKKVTGEEFFVEVTLNSVQVAEKKMLLVVWHDLTEIKHTQKNLISKAKMSSLGEMSSGLAHEINNPLAIIIGKCQMMKTKIANNQVSLEKFDLDLDKVIATSERIAKIVKGLRSFSRNSENDPMQTVFVHQVVQDTLELCTAKFRNRTIELRILDEVGPEFSIEARSSQLSQVLLNLLLNSYDAVDPLPTKWVELKISKSSLGVQIAITDSGNGIPEHLLGKLMHPFFTTKEVGKGTGLGLSISKGIVEDHQGRIFYDKNSPNTRFVVELPLTQIEKSIPTAA